MFKRLLPIFLSAVFLFSTSSVVLSADTTRDAIAENKSKLNLLNDKIMETNEKMKTLNKEMDILHDNINQNNQDMRKTEDQIEDVEIQKNQLDKEVSDIQELAGKRLRAMYMTNLNSSYLTAVITSKNITDLLTKLDAIRRIVSIDKGLLQEFEEKKEDLNRTIKDLDLKKYELQQLKDSNTYSLNELSSKKDSLKDLIKQFNDEKKDAASAIKENEEKLIAHSVSVIDSEASSTSKIRDAVSTLRSLVPQLNTASVKKKAQKYINEGNEKLAAKSVSSPRPSRGGSGGSGTYKATYTMEATAYYGHSTTATGLKPVRNPNGLSTIAVDPRVIPLGTKVYIPGYGYAIAADTGGAIKGYIIDLFLNSRSECYRWGRRNVTLHVIAYPGEW
jgi:peptidoglycan DL-endopeptidase CwlO